VKLLKEAFSMSNLQFRAWNKTNNTMVDLKAITPFALDPNLKQDGVFLPFSDDYIIMQATGVLDAVGVPIYDGDILAFKSKSKTRKPIKRRNHFIRWDGEKLRWMMVIIPKIEGLPEQCPLHIRMSETKSPHGGKYTVIGNVHANAELLQG
jgi:uncharacterized phage protein (TIGR01671 family)